MDIYKSITAVMADIGVIGKTPGTRNRVSCLGVSMRL